DHRVGLAHHLDCLLQSLTAEPAKGFLGAVREENGSHREPHEKKSEVGLECVTDPETPSCGANTLQALCLTSILSNPFKRRACLNVRERMNQGEIEISRLT